jgi:hypothetical protein
MSRLPQASSQPLTCRPGYIADYVLEVARQHPVTIERFGKEVKLGRYWMGFDYPRTAPPTYERTGYVVPRLILYCRTALLTQTQHIDHR